MLSGLEIQDALRAFAKKSSGYSGSERSEAQTFLNELFACYGSNRHGVGALFEDFKSTAGFLDLHWPGVLIVEMKAPGTQLAKATDQRRRYWQESSDPAAGVPAARFVIACNFHEFEIWEPGRFPTQPRATFPLAELPDRYDALLFLQSQTIEPVFAEHRRALTTEAATHIAELYTSLADRAAAPVPSNLTNVFAFEDDFSLGVLLSRAHDAWAWAQSSTLKTRLRYTPTSVFETSPWPDPVDEATRARVASAASTLYTRRQELCVEHGVGLTQLYNLMAEGGFADLAKLHRDLDVAVAAAYGWPASVAQDNVALVTRLTELNRLIATGERDYHPFPDPAELG